MSTVEEATRRDRRNTKGPIFRYDSWGDRRVRTGWLVAFWAVVIAAAGAGIVYGITEWVRSAGAASCHTFARQSGYPATYRVMHFLDGGTCFVKTPSGHWLPEKRVILTLRR